MEISGQLNKIIELLEDSSSSNWIAIFSLLVAIIAIIVNIVSAHKDHKQYIESIKPLLSFEFYESNGALFLSLKNTGRSEAKEIRLHIRDIRNNGDNNKLQLDDLFNSSFMLYPHEEVQGIVAYSGANINFDIFPTIDIAVSFLGGNDNKRVEYSRSITFKKNIYDRNHLQRLEDNLESISYSNNRIANYIEGRTLFRFDKLNVFPYSSLYKDMKDAFNNVDRKEDIADKKRQSDRAACEAEAAESD